MKPHPTQIVGRERRERVSQLAWCGGGALILAAASTKTFDGFSIRGLNSRKPESPMTSRSQRTIGMTPTSGRERYQFLDVLRGFALIGIITANMILYSLYLDLSESAKTSMSTHATDRVLDFLELTFIE